MEVTAKLTNLRISPYKTRLVADLIRGKSTSKALDLLAFSPKLAAKSLHKLVKSAIANATNNHNVDQETLFVKTIMVNPAPMLKRMNPRAKGRADRVLKRGSHIHLIVADKKNN